MSSASSAQGSEDAAMEKVLWKIGLAAAAVILQAMPVAAAPRGAHGGVRYTDGTGAGWTLLENRHGAVMRRGRIHVYLGRACDARSPQLGRGRWGWANGGVLITFQRRRIGFPRADPPLSRTTARCGL
jgi:hypothetical protein